MEEQKILYHYTNANGLFGIIDNNKIWASSYRYLNDSKEFEYGFDLIDELYPKPDNSPPFSNDPVSKIPDYSFAECLKRKKWDFESDCLFVASFSEEDNLLSQWRAYAGPHSGYAIGFKKSELNNGDARLVTCKYNKQEQQSFLKKFLDDILPSLRECFETRREEKQPSHAIFYNEIDRAVLKIAELAISFKHSSFKEEREWRLVVGPTGAPSKKITYRPSNTGIIPYIEISFSNNVLPIECIVIGPGPHQKRNEVSLRQWLSTSESLADVKIFKSDIPYINW